MLFSKCEKPYSHIVSSDSSFNIHNALYFVKYPSQAAQNSPEARGPRVETPGLEKEHKKALHTVHPPVMTRTNPTRQDDDDDDEEETYTAVILIWMFHTGKINGVQTKITCFNVPLRWLSRSSPTQGRVRYSQLVLLTMTSLVALSARESEIAGLFAGIPETGMHAKTRWVTWMLERTKNNCKTP